MDKNQLPGRSSGTQEIEALVRSGDFIQARRRLRALNPRELARADALGLANLARRVELSGLALRILNPIVRPSREGRLGRRQSPATAEERIEYSACLRKLGAISEAKELLGSPEASPHPQAAFQHALCLIAEWNYGGAIPLLRAYCAGFPEPSYSWFVGTINLVEALIHETAYEEASILLESLRCSRLRNEYPLLDLKMLELTAEFEIANRRWVRAIPRLEEAARSLGKIRDSSGDLYIRKWLGVVNSMLQGRIEPGLREARDEAARLGSWETLRECEFYMAWIERHVPKLERLYYGTPYPSYRARIGRILGELGIGCQFEKSYCWRQGEATETSPPDRVIDLARSELCLSGGERAVFPPGQAPHRLLIILASDFYKPLLLLSVFSLLFPGERFQPDSSPMRTRQVIKRLRHWLRDHHAGVWIEELSGSYRLRLEASSAIRVPSTPLSLDSRELGLERLRAHFPLGDFTAQQAADTLGISRSSVKNLLAEARAAELLERSGQTNRLRYRWIA